MKPAPACQPGAVVFGKSPCAPACAGGLGWLMGGLGGASGETAARGGAVAAPFSAAGGGAGCAGAAGCSRLYSSMASGQEQSSPSPS